MSVYPCAGCATDRPDHPERRQLFKQGVLAAVATVLTGAVSACVRSAAPVQTSATPRSLGTWTLRIRPADFPVLADAWGIARVDGDSDKPVAVVHTPNGYAAFSLRCPHAGATVEPKGTMFVCPGHGAEFKADGTWSGGHRARDLRSLAASYDAISGVLTITA